MDIRWCIPEACIMVKTPPGRPKGLPPVWNIGQRRNIHFVGRQQNLHDLEQALSDPNRKPQSLIGGGGCGKTALAIEYAYSHQEHYDIVWWIRADSQATITADLAALAPRLARSGQNFDDPRQACNAALEELRQRDRWLLIFDNARKAEDIDPFLPAHSAGHILITSVNPHWQTIARIQPVNAWLRQESLEFLRLRMGGMEERHAADQLAAALGDLPLALDQAAACMTQAQITITQYLKDYENLWAELLGRGRPMGSYPVHAAIAWELSFRRIEALNPVAAQLLTLCGFFSPDDIPLSMIENGSAELPHELAYGILETVTRGDALNLLDRFSVARTGEGVISIHGVIAAMAQDRLDTEERGKWAAVALRIASAGFAFDSQNPITWRSCGEVLPHVLCATMHAHGAGVVPREVLEMLSRIGRFLLKQGNYSEARSLLEMAYCMVDSAYGDRSVQAADICNNLARVRHRLGDLSGASALYEIALDIDRNNYGEDDPHLATIANNSAMTLVELGRLDEARERFEWAVGVYRKSYAKNHPKIASVMNNLGFVLMQLQDYPSARHWLEQSLTITESTFGPNHPQAACIAVNLGAALRAQGRFDVARKLFDRAMLIDQTAFGSNHPAIARDLLNLAQLLSDQENFDEAVKLLERALAITEASFGPEHRETVLCLKELGRALRGAGDAGRAVDVMMRVSAILGKPKKRKSNETVVGDEGMLA
jgi:tetratricopeptide (TPR) repeat protein